MPGMKKYILSASFALLLCGYASMAQQSEKNPDAKPGKEITKDKKKLKEYDEIVIKRKNPEKNAKVTIEIKDDEIIVDGKPIDDFSDEEISVQKRDINRYAYPHPKTPFRLEHDEWSRDFNDDFGGDFGGDLYGDTGEDRPFLGVTTEGTSEGAKVLSISENSGAAKAGLKKGDIITKVNDKTVFDHEQLSNAISELKPDDKVNITYKRDGKENKTTAILGKRKSAQTLYGADGPPMVFNFDGDGMGDLFQNEHERPRLGLKVQDTEDGKGVKVLEVVDESAAEKAGIKENDIITSFEGKQITSATELARASREAKDKASMKVQLNRNGKPQTIEVKVPKKLRTANL